MERTRENRLRYSEKSMTELDAKINNRAFIPESVVWEEIDHLRASNAVLLKSRKELIAALESVLVSTVNGNSIPAIPRERALDALQHAKEMK